MPATISLVWFLVPITTLLPGQTTLSDNIADLRNLSTRLNHRQVVEAQHAAYRANLLGMPIRRTLPNGSVTQLQKFDGMRPLYYITTNLNSARSIGTDRLWPGGDLGLQLTGYGNIIGIWDEASILSTHQEFIDRVVIMDSAASFSNHATHVAGTAIAAGLSAVARGMASEAEVISYDWNNDAAEVSAAAADGLSISNHSYSFIVGWQLGLPKTGWNWWGDLSIDTQEDYLFGFYDSTAFYWDRLAYNAPYLLMVVAAGNDRGDHGPAPGESHWVLENDEWIQSNAIRNPDGNYDCLPGGSQVAKNILVVGAVADLPQGYRDSSDVVLLDFTSWGPTDDGRIKPDIVANGWEVYSSVASGNDAYDHLTGTSMAAPSVAGSLALLKQHYADTHAGQSLLASSLRALVIHTACATGENSGPDYAYGWGLLNSADAAELILQDGRDPQIIQELGLMQGESLYTDVYCDGQNALKVTLAWTDPPGSVPAAQLNPSTSMLTNDLDLRITGDDGTVYLPWVLHATSPMLPAVTGDNTSDNIEQVCIEFPSPGEYSIAVGHKATLMTGRQTFSMVATGVSFNPLPRVLVWERDSTLVDHSGVFIRNELAATGRVDVDYFNDFPSSLDEYDAVFLAFGPSGSLSGRTYFDDQKAAVVRTYLENGGWVYLEGGDALGVDQAANDTLQLLLGIDSTESKNYHPINWLEGLSGTISEGMLFTASTQINVEYPDIYHPGSGLVAFEESDLGPVAIQSTGIHHQRTFVFSYALADLIDGTSPSTRATLLRMILDFLLEESPAPTNSPPTAVNDLAEVLEDSSTIILPLSNDTDMDGNTLRLFSLVDSYHGVTTIMEGNTAIRYAPEANYFGPDSFLYIVSDGQGGIDTALVMVEVIPVNDTPSAEDDYFEVTEDIPSSIFVLANDTDIDGDSLVVVAVTQGSHGSCAVNDTDMSITYTPAVHFTGGDTFEYVLSDGQGGMDMATVDILVIPENDPVTAIDDTVFTLEDSSVVISVLANDIDWDGDSLRILEIGIPHDGVAILGTDGTVIYTPALNYFGSDVFNYYVTDNHSGFDSAQVYITIVPVNDPPGSFSLLKPLGDTTYAIINPANLSDSLAFLWEQAPDVEGDSVYYLFDSTNDTILHILNLDHISTTQAICRYEILASQLSSFEVHSPICGQWTIIATDGMDSTTAANGPLWMTIDARLLDLSSNNDVLNEFTLQQNYPNPFNTRTLFSFDLSEISDVKLIIYNLRGEEVVMLANEQLPAGRYQVTWNGKLEDGRDAPSGLYFYTLKIPGKVTYRKMVLLR